MLYLSQKLKVKSKKSDQPEKPNDNSTKQLKL